MRKKQGVTLIETMISLTIVALSIIALLPVMTIRKEANDLTRGNRYWEGSASPYVATNNSSVSIGGPITDENIKFQVNSLGFAHSNILPVNIINQLYWDNQVINAPDAPDAPENLLYMRIEDAGDLDSTQAVFIDTDSVIINNNGPYTINRNENIYKVTKTTDTELNNIYSISNQGKEFLYYDATATATATNNNIGIGKNATRILDVDPNDFAPNNIIGIYNLQDGYTILNAAIDDVDSGLMIGLIDDQNIQLNNNHHWVIHQAGDSDITVNANVNVNKVMTNAIILASDRRLKNIITDYKKGLNEIIKINPVEFIFKKDKKQKHHIGVIAQDLKKILPEAVSKNDNGYYLVSTEPVFYSFINAIKELNNKNIELKKNNDELEQKIAKLKAIKENKMKGENDEK